MGDVWRAFDVQLGRQVALKRLPPDLTPRPDRRERFLREARVLAALRSPSLPVLYAAEGLETDGVGDAYLVLEYVEGRTLSDLLSQGPLDVERAVGLFRRLVDALAAAHAAGVTHRDLKPSNIVVRPDGEVVLVDFGLALLRGQAPASRLTLAGYVVGTVAYMSPEQARGELPGPEADVWACGVVLYEMLTGFLPFERENPLEQLGAIVHDDPVPLEARLPGAPDAVRSLVARCLTKDPGTRPANAEALRGLVPIAEVPLAGAGGPFLAPGVIAEARAHPALSRRAVFVLLAAGLAGIVLSSLAAWRALPASARAPLARPSEMRPRAAALDLRSGRLERESVHVASGVLPLPDGSHVLWVRRSARSLLVPERPPGPSTPDPSDGESLALGAGPDDPSFVESAVVQSDGRILAASRTTLVVLGKGDARILDLSREIEGASLSAVAEDVSGNVWLGTTVDGAIRVLRAGFDTFGREDGLDATFLTSIFRDGSGSVFVTAGASISRFDGAAFRTAHPRLPSSVKEAGWGTRQVALFDRAGDYWFASGDGLLRWRGPFERLDGRMPTDVLRRSNGLCGDDVFRVFEDRKGDVWAATFGACNLSRWERKAGRIRRFTAADGAPDSTGTAFAEDGEGVLWLGTYGDGVFVLESDRLVRPGPTAPTKAVVSTILRASDGRMLVGTGDRGLFVASARGGSWQFRRLTTREGLSSDTILTLVEGPEGVVFVATPQGVDRLDLATGAVRRMTWENGFPGGAVSALRDTLGCVLFATRFGLTRLCEGPEREPPPAPVLFSRVHVGNRSLSVSPFGTGSVDAVPVGPAPLPVEVEYFGIGFTPGERLSYRYRVPALDPAWSTPRPERVVRLAAVPAGRYRLEVEAIRAGRPAGRAAVLTFEVVPPFYRRPLFLGSIAALVAGLGVVLERSRVRHLVALERVRTRIATDLHDDLGSSLSRISILSEVAHGKLGDDPAASGRLLGEIGSTARELIDALSDSIWSVDPRRDDLQSLLDRVRRFAGDLLEARGVAWTVEGPGDAARVALSPLERRNLFLLAKEALHNVVKHARAGNVAITVSHRGRRLRVTISDDGVGLSGAPASSDGRGLASMSARAASLGGDFRLEAPGGGGTRLVVDVPLAEA